MLGADHERTGKPGKIINISSVSGKISVPFMGPYSMSKHALEALSDTMRRELLPHGIDVVVIEPGPVNTPIFAKTEALDFSRYEDTEYADALERMRQSSQKMGERGLEPEQIGKLVVEIFDNPSPKTRYPVMKNKFTRWTLPQLLPSRMLDRMLARRLGIKRKSVASVDPLRFVREFQKRLRRMIGFAPSVDERQRKGTGYILPVVVVLLGITMMVASGYMLADALGFW